MPTTQKIDVVRARIEPDVKKNAERILKRLGVSHSTFISMSYRAVIEAGGIPFSLHVPNAQTARVLRDAHKACKRDGYTKAGNIEDFKKSIVT